MTLNIQELSDKRKKWVLANRENGFEDGIKRLLTDLYPDNAHFIYELLQNAEDARASVVRFILNEDSVEFEHNGDRLFSIEDVDAITSIGISTKGDDPTNIGKFGVGFKAVFAYTTTPEIESGEYHFRIRDMVVPDTDGLSLCGLVKKQTRMIFPFDNPRKPPEKALGEIERNLRLLNASTLLFLNQIRKIEYLLPDSSLGYLERTEIGKNRIEISVQRPEDSMPSSAVFLRFEKDVDVNDEDGTPKSCRISVAFGIERIEGQGTEKAGKQGKQHSPAQWKIKPLAPGQVSIYFPADKETSNLRFHLHAPFASTVARDSVRDCSANNELRDHLADLISESMAAIRDRGLLTIGFLATLPNDRDNLPPFYKPIQNSLLKAFQNENLTPMKQGGHAAANGIFSGPAQLSNLISDDDLATILGENYFPPLWVANPPQRNQREDIFLSMLNISEWTTENLVSALSTQSESIMKWLAEKTDEWHQQLYALFGDSLSKERLAGLRIVRISDGSYSIGSMCYFPSEGVEHDDLMPRVCKGVYTSGKSEEQQKKAKDFLKKIGVREVGEAEQVEAILKDRYSQAAVDSGAFNPRMEDIKRFITLIEKNPLEAKLFKDYFIFKLTNGRWGKPSKVFLDTPFLKTDLNVYYTALGDKSQCRALSQDYEDCEISLSQIGEFAKKVGAKTILDIKKIEYSWMIDYTIDYLDEVLQLKSLSISKLIWNTLVEYEKHSIIIYLWRSELARKYFYPTGDSMFIAALKLYQWIPQVLGSGNEFTFVKPADADSRMLPDGFSFDNGWEWLKSVKFGSSLREREELESKDATRKTAEYQHAEKAAKSLGFESSEEAKEVAELKQKDPEGYYKWRDSNKEKPYFPNQKVKDPERRQEGIKKQIAEAPEKESEIRERNVRITRTTVSPSQWLREKYTNDVGQMVCQICKNEMPFKKRDGEYYFEAVEALSKDHFPKEHEAQFLALCPLCAAMYKELVKLDESSMNDLACTLKNSDELVLPIKLGELETSIQFVESHFSDIKTILNIKGDGDE